MTAQTIETDEGELDLYEAAALGEPCETDCQADCQADCCELCEDFCLACQTCCGSPRDEYCTHCREWCETDCSNCCLPDEEAYGTFPVLLAGYVNAGLGPWTLYRCPDCAHLAAFRCMGPLVDVPAAIPVAHLCATEHGSESAPATSH